MTALTAPQLDRTGNPANRSALNRQAEIRQAVDGPSTRWTEPARHPLSRWYLCRLVDQCAAALRLTALRPTHVTWVGIAAIIAAVWGLSQTRSEPQAWLWAAVAIWLAWFCDRLDGALARAQQTATAWGKWLDANVDELADLAIHAGLAYAVSDRSGGAGWMVFGAFAAAKHLFSFGLSQEQLAHQGTATSTAAARNPDLCSRGGSDMSGQNGRTDSVEFGCDAPTRHEETPSVSCCTPAVERVRTIYHLAGNADVRTHLLIVCVATGYAWPALLFSATYFNLRWIVRFWLVAHRLGGES